jgi:hypothetical protein
VRWTRDTRLLVDGPVATQADPALLRARELRHKLMQSGEASLTETAKAEGVSRTYLTRVARLAFLSPEITTAILDGRQPVHLTAARLSSLTDLPLAWTEQRRPASIGIMKAVDRAHSGRVAPEVQHRLYT